MSSRAAGPWLKGPEGPPRSLSPGSSESGTEPPLTTMGGGRVPDRLVHVAPASPQRAYASADDGWRLDTRCTSQRVPGLYRPRLRRQRQEAAPRRGAWPLGACRDCLAYAAADDDRWPKFYFLS